jgi:ABC-type Fe3+/spermidine/putrescine transport system ATPase subunit
MQNQETNTPERSTETTSNEVVLSVENLKKVYPDETVAVDGIDFEVERGEFCVIIGPSGCGKTTTLHSLIGKIEPTSGAVRVDGRDTVGMPTYERDTGLVFQDFQLFPHTTVEENVRYGLERREMSEAERDSKVSQYLELTNLEEHRERMPDRLSAGQKQRVALARSLVLEPQLVLLDEPLGDLDYKLQKKLERELLRIQRTADATFVYVTHDQTQAMRLADKIVVMNDGHVEQAGTVNDVYHNPATAFVATFIGDSNIFSGRVTDITDGGAYAIVETPYGTFRAGTSNLDSSPDLLIGEDMPFSVRPQYFHLSDEKANTIEATVTDVLRHPGSGIQLMLEAEGTDGETNELHVKSWETIDAPSGQLTLSWDPDETILLERTSVLPDVDLNRDILGQE